MFTEEFLDSLPLQPIDALRALCSEYHKFASRGPISDDDCLEAYAAFREFSIAYPLAFAPTPPELTGRVDRSALHEYAQHTIAAIDIQKSKDTDLVTQLKQLLNPRHVAFGKFIHESDGKPRAKPG